MERRGLRSDITRPFIFFHALLECENLDFPGLVSRGSESVDGVGWMDMWGTALPRCLVEARTGCFRGFGGGLFAGFYLGVKGKGGKREEGAMEEGLEGNVLKQMCCPFSCPYFCGRSRIWTWMVHFYPFTGALDLSLVLRHVLVGLGSRCCRRRVELSRSSRGEHSLTAIPPRPHGIFIVQPLAKQGILSMKEINKQKVN